MSSCLSFCLTHVIYIFIALFLLASPSAVLVGTAWQVVWERLAPAQFLARLWDAGRGNSGEKEAKEDTSPSSIPVWHAPLPASSPCNMVKFKFTE